MLDSLQKYDKATNDFKLAAKERHNLFIEDEESLKKERSTELRKLRASHMAQERALFSKWEKADVKRSRETLSDERKKTAVLFNKLHRLMTSNLETATASPPLSVEEDEALEVSPVTTQNLMSKKRARSPRGDDETKIEYSLPEMTPFERRRRENLVQNQALLNDIALPETPKKSSQRRVPRAMKTPVETPAKRARASRYGSRNEQELDDEQPTAGMDIISISSGSPLSSARSTINSWEPVDHTITMSGIDPWEHAIEFPHSSQHYYVMRCAGCSEGFGSVGKMLLHLKASNHRHLLNGDETGFNTVKVCGRRIVDATPEWVASGGVRYQTQSGTDTDGAVDDRTIVIDSGDKTKVDAIATKVDARKTLMPLSRVKTARTESGLGINRVAKVYNYYRANRIPAPDERVPTSDISREIDSLRTPFRQAPESSQYEGQYRYW